MKPTKTTLGLAALSVIVMLCLALSVEHAKASGDECGPCGGPVQTATGGGSGNNCSQALDEAYDDALTKAYSGGAACSPCQVTNGYQSCSLPSCYPGPCPPGSYRATWTLNYKCETCDPGGPQTGERALPTLSRL